MPRNFGVVFLYVIDYVLPFLATVYPFQWQGERILILNWVRIRFIPTNVRSQKSSLEFIVHRTSAKVLNITYNLEKDA